MYVDAGVSHARPPADVDIEPATYALAGGRFVAGPVFGSLYGGLATDQDVADWIGGRLGVWLRSAGSGRLGWALTGMLSAFSLGEPTPYEAVTVRLVPEARLTSGRTALVLRGYGGLGRSDVAERSVEPPVSVVSDLWMYGGGLELSRPLGSAQLWAGLEAYGTANGSYYAGYVGSVAPLGGALAGAGLKVWDTLAGVELEMNFSLAVPLGSRWSAEMRAGRSGPDPLLGSPAAVDGSAVASLNVYVPRPPAPVVTVNRGEATVAVFRLEIEDAEAVSVIGDFSGWEPIPMHRRGEIWTARIPVQPGLYHFGFLVDGDWRVPENAPGKITDEFGRTNATLVVPVQ